MIAQSDIEQRPTAGGRKAPAHGGGRALPVLARATLVSVIIFSVLLCPNLGHANEVSTFKELTKECVEVIDGSSNGFATRLITVPIADKLETIAQEFSRKNQLSVLLPELDSGAARCVAFSRQVTGELLFSPSQARYLSSRQVRAAVAAEREAQIKAEREAELLAIQREREELNAEINRRVFGACSQLAWSNPTEAFTNEICIEAFRANGLPQE